MNFILPTKEAEALLIKELKQIRESGFLDEKKRFPVTDFSHMLGLLIARSKTGEKVVLKAFSGAAGIAYLVPSYVPPCFSAKTFEEIVDQYNALLHCYTDRIEAGEKDLEAVRRALSNECLEKIKANYLFYSPYGKLTFKDMGLENLPTGAGDCATVKLISYCFKKGFTPISLAEIKLDDESNTLQPPCEERCHPILSCLFGLDLLYSDEDIAVINKEAGMLSVPGRGEEKKDSASERIKTIFPTSPDPPSVHRLDMDTSGILLFAKTEEAKRKLSMQFEKRETEKVYVALLEGVIKEDEGTIDLPIRLSVEDRPRQVVDFKEGKEAKTLWKKLGVEYRNGEKVTRVRFFPKTGRTHQIRVHAKEGLAHPIVGDRLYGKRTEGERLCLHAESLTFTHPSTGERLTFTSPAPF